jgi:two-component system, cell cycle sensor histidine kinase and response regulator CckA
MVTDSLNTIIIFGVWGIILAFLIYFYIKRRTRVRGSHSETYAETQSAGTVMTADLAPTTGTDPSPTLSYLQQILDNIDVVFFKIDSAGIFTLSEGKGLANIGFKKEEVVGRSVFELYKDNKEILGNIRRAMNGESFSSVVRSAGRVFQTHYKPVLSENNIVEVTGIAFDITEHQDAKDHLRESEERFQILAENIPGVIYLCNNDDEYSTIYINRQIELITGYSMDEFENGTVTIAQLIHPDDKANVVRYINEMVEAQKPFEISYRMKHKDGSWKWVSEIGVGVIRNDRPVMLEGFITDISDQKMIENALKESEEKLRKIVEKSNDAIYVIQGKQFVMINDKFQEIFGYSESEVLSPGFTFMNLLDEDSIPLIEERRRKRERGEDVSDRISFIGRTKDQKKIHVEASLATIEWEGKSAVLGILRDMTSQRQLEEQFRHSQKIEAVGRLAGGLAHDFNNILTAISGYAELVAAKVPDGQVKDNINEIITASDRATKLVQQLLAFSRRQVIKPIPVNLNAIITAMDSLLHRVVGENTELHTHFEETLGTIEIDPALVEQVIMNLVINARDAMPDGGILSVETFNTELSSEYGHMHPEVLPGKYVALAISDTGIGIAEDIRDQIYEPFFTTKEKGKGTGLGLSTVYGIVMQSGGHIWCYSEVANGTTFKIYFPRVDKEVPPTVTTERTAVEEVPKAMNETILIAEDEDSVRRFCANVLSDLGYNILQAKDGMEALQISQRHPEKIDLLVADIMMPGLNGKELAHKLCKERTSLKVIFISGYTNSVIVNRGILDPGIAFIQKPFTPKMLGIRVREVLDGTQYGAGQ